MLESYVIERDGDAPLAFEGKLLAEACTRRASGPGQNRWHEIAVYIAAPKGLYVAKIVYFTRWSDEHDVSEAAVFGSAAEVVAWLRGHDPCREALGYPPGPTFNEKNARMRADLASRYRAAVGDVLSDPVFHVAPALAAPAQEG